MTLFCGIYDMKVFLANDHLPGNGGLMVRLTRWGADEDPSPHRRAVRLDQDHRRRAKLRYKGRQRNRAWFVLAGATYNLIRIAALDAQPA